MCDFTFILNQVSWEFLSISICLSKQGVWGIPTSILERISTSLRQGWSTSVSGDSLLKPGALGRYFFSKWRCMFSESLDILSWRWQKENKQLLDSNPERSATKFIWYCQAFPTLIHLSHLLLQDTSTSSKFFHCMLVISPPYYLALSLILNSCP